MRRARPPPSRDVPRTGDAAATEALLGAVHRLVHRYCRARLARYPGAEHAADDVAQEGAASPC